MPVTVETSRCLVLPLRKSSVKRPLAIFLQSSVSPVFSLKRSGVRFPCGTSSTRSEEHTSELQSQSNLVCRLLLEKKKKITIFTSNHNNTSHDICDCNTEFTALSIH